MASQQQWLKCIWVYCEGIIQNIRALYFCSSQQNTDLKVSPGNSCMKAAGPSLGLMRSFRKYWDSSLECDCQQKMGSSAPLPANSLCLDTGQNKNTTSQLGFTQHSIASIYLLLIDWFYYLGIFQYKKVVNFPWVRSQLLVFIWSCF